MSKQGEDKNNILSMDSLKEKHGQEFKMAEAFVNLDGEMLSYKYYEKLPETKKNEYIQEFLEFSFKLANDEEYKEIPKESVSLYALILLIDKFTDIDIPQDDKEKLVYAGFLADFSLVGKILETLPEEEIIDTMTKGTKVVEEQTKRAQELLKQYESKAENIEELSSLRLAEKELEEADGKEDE